MIDPKKWFTETSYRNTVASSFKIKEVLHSEQSKFQKIEVLQTEAIGRLLLLDGKTMVSDHDEFVYHEVMGHIPMNVHPNAKNVLIIGGGDGGIVREYVRYPDIERVDLVEIDERVIEVSKEFFPDCTSGLSDPRVNILPQDGIEYIKNCKNEYDIIIIDSTDPEDFAEGLFTKDFYSAVYSALKDDGIMMNQTENPFYDEYGVEKIYQNLKDAFPIVQSLFAPMCIYPGVYWTFGFSSKKYKGTELCESRGAFAKELDKDLKWYNRDWHVGAFNLSNFHKRKIGLD